MPEGRPVDRDRFREYLSDEKDDADFSGFISGLKSAMETAVIFLPGDLTKNMSMCNHFQ